MMVVDGYLLLTATWPSPGTAIFQEGEIIDFQLTRVFTVRLIVLNRVPEHFQPDFPKLELNVLPLRIDGFQPLTSELHHRLSEGFNQIPRRTLERNGI